MKIPSKQIIEHIDDGNLSSFKNINNSNTKKIWIIYKSNWKLATVLPYLRKDFQCTFFTEIPENINNNEGLLFIEDSEFNNVLISNKNDIQHFSYFTLYK